MSIAKNRFISCLLQQHTTAGPANTHTTTVLHYKLAHSASQAVNSWMLMVNPMWIFVGWGLNCCLDDISFSDLFLPLQVHTMMLLETQVGLERDVDRRRQ